MPDNVNNIRLRSEEVQEILTAVPIWMIRWGNSLIFALIIMVLGISWSVKYPDIIASEAIITTPIPPQKEYAKASGKIDTLLVVDNQSVKMHTPLAVIENTANFEDVFLLKFIVDTIRLSKTRFVFPVDDLPILFLGEIESDFALFENSYDQYLLNKQLQPFSHEATANRSALIELNNRLSNLELQQKLNTAELGFKKNELERNRILFEEGVISAQDYENKQLENLQAERSFENLTLAISQIKETISNTNSSSKSIEINRQKEEKVLLRNVIQSFNQLKRAIKDWELTYVLKSTIAGKVSFLDFWAKNQTVNAGDLAFTIISQENAGYIARLKTPALNAGKIKTGQTVNIKLANYPAAEFGVLQGSIKNISLVTDKDGFYAVDVALTSELVTTYNKHLEFRQEMQGIAEIITEDLRLIERFFYQLKKILSP